MHTFDIETMAVNRESERIRQTGRSLAGDHVKLENISSQVRSMDGSLRILSTSIDRIAEQVIRNSKNVSSYGTSMASIVKAYVNAEQQIAWMKGKPGDGSGAYAVKTGGTGETSVWGKDNSYVHTTTDGKPWIFHQGSQSPARPNLDRGYPYDPNMKAGPSDYFNWAKWGVICEGADFLDHLPDGVEAYKHYRNGDGSDLEINFPKAYKQDPVIRQNTDRAVAETNKAVQQMIAAGAKPPFTITSECRSAGGYPSTENWQKAIGGYQTWVSADVSYDDQGNIVVNTTVHEWDRYNFDDGKADMTTREPDDVNGRFEALGWAHSFDTYGSVSFKSTITADGEIGVPDMISSDGRNRVGYDTRTWR